MKTRWRPNSTIFYDGTYERPAMKTEEEVLRYIRCMEKLWEETSSTQTQVIGTAAAAIVTAKWVLGKAFDPPGYAELLALDEADDKRMDGK